MKQLSKTIAILFICAFSLTFFQGCDSNSGPCEDTACTLVFVMVGVTITDQNQDPVVLDGYELINTETNTLISLSLSVAELEQSAQMGFYPIMDDLSLGENQEINIEFVGYQNNQEVVRRTYVVAKDCCHVFLVSGDTEITL